MGKLLGDIIADGIKALGLAPEKPCTPCEKRRRALNEAHRRAKEKARGKR